jgi:hypothetical protein
MMGAGCMLYVAGGCRANAARLGLYCSGKVNSDREAGDGGTEFSSRRGIWGESVIAAIAGANDEL